MNRFRPAQRVPAPRRLVIGPPDEDGIRRIDLGRTLGAAFDGQWIDVQDLDNWPLQHVMGFTAALTAAPPTDMLAIGLRFFVRAWRVRAGGWWLPPPAEDAEAAARLPYAVAAAVVPWLVSNMRTLGKQLAELKGGD